MIRIIYLLQANIILNFCSSHLPALEMGLKPIFSSKLSQ
jgi:hypothetical protein